MIKNIYRFLPVLMLLFASCDTSGVKKTDGEKTDTSSSLLDKKGDDVENKKKKKRSGSGRTKTIRRNHCKVV